MDARATAATYPDLSGKVATVTGGASGIGEAIVRTFWVTPEAEADLLDKQCLKRTLGPEDVAHVVLFLASRTAGRITAQSIVVDGGWT